MDKKRNKAKATIKYNARMAERLKVKPKKIVYVGHREKTSLNWDSVVVNDPEIGKAVPYIKKVHVHIPKAQRG